MNLYFGLFCSAGVLFNSGELTKKNLKKKLLIPILHMFVCLVSIHSSKLRVYIKDWSPSSGSGATVGLICSRNIRLSTFGV